MTQDQAAADRAVINAAKTIERAAQYGIPDTHAHERYDQARNRQAAARKAGGR